LAGRKEIEISGGIKLKNPIDLTTDADFQVLDWGTEAIGLNLSKFDSFRGNIRADECHIKTDGDLDNKPSVAFLLRDGAGNAYVAQISARMLKPVIDRLKWYESQEDLVSTIVADNIKLVWDT
jgi:hypothetical protein